MPDVIRTIRVANDKTLSGYSDKTVREVPWESAASEAEILYVSPDVSTIAATAFMGFGKLREAYLPGVISIGISAFYMCERLEAIEMPKVCVIGSSAFERCVSLERLLIRKPGVGELVPKTKINLPRAMAIGNFAFINCRKLASISAPQCASVGKHAFMWCKSLTEVSLPNATQIGEGAFMRCQSLKKVKIHASAAVGKSALTGSGVNWFEYFASTEDTQDSSADSLVFFDLETTGKLRDSEITEIGAVKIRLDGSISGYFQTFAKPTRKIPQETVDFNGINDDMVEGAPTQYEAVAKFLNFIGDLPIVGHNIEQFDIPILTKAYAGDLPVSEVIDTLMIASEKDIPGAADNKQTTIYGSALAYGGVEPSQVQGQAHRALYDADVNRIVYLYLQTLEAKKSASRKHHSTGNSGAGKYFSPENQKKHPSVKELRELKPTVNPDRINPKNPFFGKHVCQTTVEDERDIWQLVVNLGGIPEANAVNSMDVLIIGKDGNGLNQGKPTRKVEKAEELRENGKEIWVLPEEEFWRLVEGGDSNE